MCPSCQPRSQTSIKLIDLLPLVGGGWRGLDNLGVMVCWALNQEMELLGCYINFIKNQTLKCEQQNLNWKTDFLYINNVIVVFLDPKLMKFLWKSFFLCGTYRNDDDLKADKTPRINGIYLLSSLLMKSPFLKKLNFCGQPLVSDRNCHCLVSYMQLVDHVSTHVLLLQQKHSDHVITVLLPIGWRNQIEG